MRLSIRFRLISVLILLTVIPLVVTSYFLAKINETSIKTQTKEYQLGVTTQLTNMLDNMLESTHAGLVKIEMLLNDPSLPTEETIRLAGYIISTSRQFDFVNIYGTEGKFIDGLYPGSSKSPIVSPPLLPNTIREGLKGKESVIGKPIIKDGGIYLPTAITWKSDNKLQGYLWTALDISYLSSQLADIVKGRFSTKIDSAFILDSSFQQLAHSAWLKVPSVRTPPNAALFKELFPGDRIPNEKIGISSDHRDNNGHWLINLNTLPGFNWLLVIVQEKKEGYRILYDMQERILSVGSLFILVAVLLGIFLGGRLTRPILKVAQGARELASQKFSHRIRVKAKDEIGDMANAFNSLGQSLEEYDARIKKEVAIRSDLSRYLTPELVEAIIHRKANLKLGGTRQHVTVLFADVVSFTPLTERLEPEKTVALLNELFTILTQIVFRNNGMIDKFIGDCVMALFGAPNPDSKGTQNAVNTAVEMLRWLEAGNKKWKRQYDIEIKLAISIHCGEVIIGNIGSEKRMEFTAIGDVVNTADRIEKIAQANQVLISRDVYEKLEDQGDFHFKSHGRFALRGKNKEIDVFEVVQ